MRTHQHCITVLILAAFTSASTLQPLHGQEVESKPVKFFINNLPDKQPPTIRLISPFFPANDTFRTGTKEIDLIGEVTDQSGVRFVSVNSDIRNINEAGIFSSRLVLVPGHNQIRLVTSDELDNLAEIIYAVEYIPPFQRWRIKSPQHRNSMV